MKWNARLFATAFVAMPASIYAGQSLEDFARECNEVIGTGVPDFDCDNGTLVPATHLSNGVCDRPDQLNQDCDPGSRFQVLTNNATAYVVAHCRKRNEDQNPGKYGDIAVIQHSRVTGATCFYQGALKHDHSGMVKAPSKGVGNPVFWMTPSDIVNSTFPCASCHDNGPIIRSPYLTQVSGPNTLPGAHDSRFNRDQPYSFVGSDFASWKAYKVEVSGNLCNGCHRLGVNNVSGDGTARDFAIRATDRSQKNKNPHSNQSPMWMLPGQTVFSQANADSAKQIKECADRFHEGSSLPNTPDCAISQFAGRFVGTSTLPSIAPIVDYILNSFPR